ncbi:NAD(P)-dependent oxidoreductase [Pseudoclavibacter sp. 13-3]|uniref:NAD(P)-dependent oxidoreductase n=1 Tax=Pseudoclavibacter sp. 13-3 TaxID=2901228 RepID=UPI001E48F9AE|nr:NAD(P)-dependent oxidoreductase [Pseudoclavibacter sp. 13-3]MCD7101302.1 C-terminal binding protein [Pseudoclavibacter sp. 13-3]
MTRLPLAHQRDILQETLGAGYRVVMGPNDLNDPAAVAMVAETDLSFGRNTILAPPNLKVIITPSVGTDHVDLATAKQRGVQVVNTPGHNRREAADHTLALILNVIRDLRQADRVARTGEWNVLETRPRLIRGRRLGLIGFGDVAQLVAMDALALGMDVLVHEIKGLTPAAEAAGARQAPDLMTLLSSVDIVSLHIPLTPATRGLIGAQQLRMMKPGSAIINTARGAIIDQKALARAIDEGHILHAALDVLETEPPAADDPLLSMGRVLLTPHMGWYSDRSATELYRDVGGRLRTLLDQILQE